MRKISLSEAVVHLCMSRFWHFILTMFHLWETRTTQGVPWCSMDSQKLLQFILRGTLKRTDPTIDDDPSMEIFQPFRRSQREPSDQILVTGSTVTQWMTRMRLTLCPSRATEDGQKRDRPRPGTDRPPGLTKVLTSALFDGRIPLPISNVCCQGSGWGRRTRGDRVGM